MAVAVQLAFLCVIFAFSFAQSTTPYIPEVFVGKCYERNPSGMNCTALWDAFSKAATISNTVVNAGDYAPFFALSNFSTPRNGILFWSGNQAFALSISNSDNQRFTTVEGTSTGYVLNGLSWCGNPNSSTPGFDFTDPCIYSSNATYFGTQGVWSQCSELFSQGATGNITILLQPARQFYNSGPYLAYRNTSIFYQVELPSLIRAQVANITVLLLKNHSVAPDEKCGHGSLLALDATVKAKFGFKPECIDNPKTIYNLLCPDGENDTPQCMAASLAYPEGGSETMEGTYLVWALVATVTAVAFLVLTTYFALRVRHNSYTPLKTLHD